MSTPQPEEPPLFGNSAFRLARTAGGVCFAALIVVLWAAGVIGARPGDAWGHWLWPLMALVVGVPNLLEFVATIRSRRSR